MKKVSIHTDGSCLNNAGENSIGGYCGIILCSNNKEKVILGAESNITNNRMELKAIIESIKELDKGQVITIYSDSQISVNGINSWLGNWQKNNWKNANRKPIANRDLWEGYLKASEQHSVSVIKVKGHISILSTQVQLDKLLIFDISACRACNLPPRQLGKNIIVLLDSKPEDHLMQGA